MGRVLESGHRTHTVPSEECTGTHRPLVCSGPGCSTEKNTECGPLLSDGFSPAQGPSIPIPLVPHRTLQAASGLEAAAGTD